MPLAHERKARNVRADILARAEPLIDTDLRTIAKAHGVTVEFVHRLIRERRRQAKAAKAAHEKFVADAVTRAPLRAGS